MNKKSFVSPSFFRQKVRQIKKQKSLTQHQALEEVAQLLGYSNYKNYLNQIEPEAPPQPRQATQAEIDAVQADKEELMAKRAHLISSKTPDYKPALRNLISTLADPKLSKSKIQSICEGEPALKGYLEHYFFMDFLRDEESEIHDFAPYHIAKGVLLKNLVYKFENQTLYIEGDYDLKLEFAFDYDKDAKHDTFEDQEMFGSFELTLDESLEINIENQDIGYNW